MRSAVRLLTGMLVLLVLFVHAGGLVPHAAAQRIPARLDAYTPADSVAVGDRFPIVVTAEHRFAVKVRFPEADAGPMIFGDVQVLSRTDRGQRYLGAAAPGERIDSVIYTATTFALDSARVPSLPVDVITATGDTVTGATPAVAIPVYATVPTDEDQLRGLAPLADFPEPMWPWVLLVVAGVSLVGLLAYLWWNRQNEEPADAPAPKPEPETTPHERVTEMLDLLARVDLSDRSNVKPFYVHLSTGLRRYLADRLDFPAMERTTREVVNVLERRTDVPPVITSRVRSVLEQADLVKFSNARADAEDGETALRDVRHVVELVESQHVEVASAQTNGSAPTQEPRDRRRDGRRDARPEA